MARQCPILVLLLTALLAGCTQMTQSEKAEQAVGLGDSFDETKLVIDTYRVLTEAYVGMVSASAEAARSSADTRVREDSIRWRILTATRIDRIRALDDPRIRFAALWTLAVQMRIELSDTTRPPRFGAEQPLYQKYAADLEEQVVKLAYDAFPDAAVKQATPAIEQMARGLGMAGWLTPRREEIQRGALEQIVSAPLSPISGLQGVGDTPAAINRFTDAAREMTEVVENLPERTRWQVELLLLEAESSGALSAALHEMRRIREQFAATLASAPEQFRQILADLEKSSPTLRKDMQQMQQVIAEARATVGEVHQTIAEAQVASSAVSNAAVEVRKAAEEIHSGEKSRRDERRRSASNAAATTAESVIVREREERNDLRKAQAAAIEVKAAAAEIRGLVADLAQERSLPAVNRSADRLEAMINRTLWRIAALIALTLAGILLVIIVARRIPRRSA